MKTALVHDYLNQRGGAERVFAHFVRAWPEAPVYTALYDARAVGDLVPAERVHTSFLQRFPARSRGRWCARWRRGTCGPRRGRPASSPTRATSPRG